MNNDIMPATLTLKIQSWDYQQSVERIRPKVVGWKTLTAEMAREFCAPGVAGAKGCSSDGCPSVWKDHFGRIRLCGEDASCDIG